MPQFRETISVDDYVLDVLMRDIVGHDRQPAAYLVYLFLYGRGARTRWRPVEASLRLLADETGLSKSAVQTALELLRRRELIQTKRKHPTATPTIASSVIGGDDASLQVRPVFAVRARRLV